MGKPEEEKRNIPHMVRMSSKEDSSFWSKFSVWRMENPKGSKTDYIIECCCK